MTNLENRESIHLKNFINFNNIKIDNELIYKMNFIREICSTISYLRKESNIRVRIPLKNITICGSDDYLKNLDLNSLNIIKNEVNCKNIILNNDNLDTIAKVEISLNFKNCGKKFGKDLQIISQNKDSFEKLENDQVKILDFILDKEDYNFIYRSKNENNKLKSCCNSNILIIIEDTIDKDIFLSTLARDLIRSIQIERKNKSLNIEDKIDVEISVNIENINTIIFDKIEEIKKETLCKNISFKENNNNLISLQNEEYKNIINNIEILCHIQQ